MAHQLFKINPLKNKNLHNNTDNARTATNKYDDEPKYDDDPPNGITRITTFLGVSISVCIPKTIASSHFLEKNRENAQKPK